MTKTLTWRTNPDWVGSINGTGNSLNNILVGNLADNELFGFSVTTHCVVDLGTTPLRVGKALTCFTVKQATTLSKVGLLGGARGC